VEIGSTRTPCRRISFILGFTVNRVRVLLPDPHDPSQSINSTRAGRSGWKAGVDRRAAVSGRTRERAGGDQPRFGGVALTLLRSLIASHHAASPLWGASSTPSGVSLR
jgi:hypothetical protein